MVDGSHAVAGWVGRGAVGVHTPPRPYALTWLAASAAFLVLTFAGDYLTGNEISFGLFYVIAVATAAWFAGRAAGLTLALASTVAWALSYGLVDPTFLHASAFYWNGGVELGIYLAIAVAADHARSGLDRTRALAEHLDHALDRERRTVGDLQQRLLPAQPPELTDYEWDRYYAPSARAGGDYYDFFPLPDGRIGILVADASGHGVTAVALMAMARVLLHTTPEPLAPPTRVLGRLNHQLACTLPAGWFITACYAVLDPARGRIEYALAGHEPPLVVRRAPATLERLDLLGGPPLGPFPYARFESGATLLQPGDTLVLYTDGLTEAVSPEREMFGDVRLGRELAGARDLSAPALRERLVASLDGHVAGAPPTDDLTLVLLRRLPAPATRRAARAERESPALA